MSITTNEIAKICNVSRGTVDRALNGRAGINPKTKEMILQTAKELGYVPHLLASSLATGKTYTVGLVVFDLVSRHFAELVTSVQRNLLEKGIFCYICITGKDQDQETQLVSDLMARKVDGMIISPINDGPEFLAMLLKWGKPIVAVNNTLDERFSFVGGNSDLAVYKGMRYFFQKGYRDVLFVCPPYRRLGQENLYAQLIRVDGFQRFLRENTEMHGTLVSDESYLDIVLSLIQNHNTGKLGVFCSSDHYALKIYKAAREHGLSAPKDFGLMGFDGIDTLQYLDSRITTMYYPAEKIGDISANCLHQMIHGAKQPVHTVIDCPLVEGTTL